MHQLEGRPSGRPSFFWCSHADVIIYCVIATVIDMASAIAPLISVPDAADALGLSPARVRLLAANGGLPAQKIGGRWLLERSGVEKRRARGSAGGRPVAP